MTAMFRMLRRKAELPNEADKVLGIVDYLRSKIRLQLFFVHYLQSSNLKIEFFPSRFSRIHILSRS
jgi:hypothetical protein